MGRTAADGCVRILTLARLRAQPVWTGCSLPLGLVLILLILYVACAAVFTTQVHDGTTTPLNQFMKDPDSLITRVTWKDEQDKVRIAQTER
jgi:hypothetical protein